MHDRPSIPTPITARPIEPPRYDNRDCVLYRYETWILANLEALARRQAEYRRRFRR